MPLVFRVTTFVLETQAGAAGEVEPRKVPLWISLRITPRLRAKSLIDTFLVTVERRVNGTLFIGDVMSKDEESGKRRGFFDLFSLLRKKQKDAKLSNRSTKHVDWSLCVCDADGVFHFCGDTKHYAKSRLINIPFLTETVVKSHSELETLQRSINTDADGSKGSHLEDPGGVTQSMVWLASTSAAVQFADEQCRECAVVKCAIVPSEALRQWNKSLKSISLYQAVKVPDELSAEPVEERTDVGESATGDATKSFSRALSIRTEPLPANFNEGGAFPSQSPKSVNGTGCPSSSSDAGRDSSTEAETDGEGGWANQGTQSPPPLPLKDMHQTEQDGLYDEKEKDMPKASSTKSSSSSTSTHRDRHGAIVPTPPLQPLQARRACLATHATDLLAVGPIDPVVSLWPSENSSIWRRPDVKLDGVSEQERQRMIAEEDAARLRLAKAHLLYEDTLKRYHSVSPAGPDVAEFEGRKAVLGVDPEACDLSRQRDALREAIARNKKAEKECDTLALLVELCEKDIAGCETRTAQLRSAVECST